MLMQKENFAMENRKEITIEVCMGSSCFMRGNAENLKFIESFVASHNIHSKIDLFGSRCKRECDKGPNVVIDGVSYHNIGLNELEEILEEKFFSIRMR